MEKKTDPARKTSEELIAELRSRATVALQSAVNAMQRGEWREVENLCSEARSLSQAARAEENRRAQYTG